MAFRTVQMWEKTADCHIFLKMIGEYDFGKIQEDPGLM